MADIGSNLRITFGLISDPTPIEQLLWARRTEAFIRRGSSREAAGWAAARRVFGGVGLRTYASEGDTIGFLLKRVRDK